MHQIALTHVSAYERYRVAAAGFGIQLVLGAIYNWSILLAPLQERFNASLFEANICFSIALALLGIGAAIGGCLMQRIGPRATATLAGILYGGGVLGAGFAPDLQSFYVAYGFVAGIGLGLGYIVPVAVLLQWFPERRGWIAGLAVTGFGLGGLVSSPVVLVLVQRYGIQITLITLGVFYLAAIVILAQWVRSAPAGYAPESDAPQNAMNAAFAEATPALTLTQSLCTRRWYILWIVFAINVAAGAAMISVLVLVAKEFSGASTGRAVLALCIVSLCNGVGRVLWGSLSDRCGRMFAVIALLALQCLAFATMCSVENFWVLLIAVSAIALCYGGGFGIMPAYAADLFGQKHAGSIYGALMTAFSVGVVAGPLLMASLPFRIGFLLILGLLVVASLLPQLVEALEPGRSGVLFTQAAHFHID